VKRGARIAIVGATGLVGETLVATLEDRGYEPSMLALFASARSAGTTREAFGKSWPVSELSGSDDFAGIDIAFFAAGAATSIAHARAAASAGALVIDKSAAFRLDDSVPLIVPEINARRAIGARLIANPNCATIPLALTLAPIAREFGLAWASVATYQSVSGAGRAALVEYRAQCAGALEVTALPRRIAGSVIPENGSFDADGRGDEERKIAAELKKILELPDLRVSATSVRVPVAIGHCEAVSFGTRRPATRAQIADAFRSAPGLSFLDGAGYATPLDVVGTDEVAVGRLRPDDAHASGWLCWIACDNLRKGAATNAVQIAEAVGAATDARTGSATGVGT
jgi:aspartate-semialdehyde dehydrogenase